MPPIFLLNQSRSWEDIPKTFLKDLLGYGDNEIEQLQDQGVIEIQITI